MQMSMAKCFIKIIKTYDKPLCKPSESILEIVQRETQHLLHIKKQV